MRLVDKGAYHTPMFVLMHYILVVAPHRTGLWHASTVFVMCIIISMILVLY